MNRRLAIARPLRRHLPSFALSAAQGFDCLGNPLDPAARPGLLARPLTDQPA